MKQNFVRLSTRAKTVSLRTLALVMGLVMLLSAVGVGSTLSAFALTNDGSGDQAASLSAAADLGTGIADTATQLKPTLPAYANASLRGDKEDLAGTGADADLAATGNFKNWNIYGKVYFLAPSSFIGKNVYHSIDQVGTNYHDVTKLALLGTSSNSRLYYAWVSKNHSNYEKDEYHRFIADSASKSTGNWDLGSYYTAGNGVGIASNDTYFLFTTASDAESAGAAISKSDKSKRTDLNTKQTLKPYLGSSSNVTTGGKIDFSYWELNGDAAMKSSATTGNTSTFTSYDIYPVIGSKVTLSASANTGYTFDGWYEGTTKVSDNATYSYWNYGEKTDIRARFKAATYTVTLNTDGGTINSGDVTSYTYGTGATLPTDVTKAGYEFEGWYTESSGGNKVTKISTTDTGNKTYYAHWKQLTADFQLIGDVGADCIATVNGNANAGTGAWPGGSGWDSANTLEVNTATGTPGVYKIVVETKDTDKTINIGLYQKSANVQRGYKLGDTFYNTVGADYEVPNSGVTDADNLYIVDGTGSIVLAPDTEYTITIDQTKPLSSTYPFGKITITTNKADVHVIARVKKFDISTGELGSEVSNAPAYVGTAVAGTSTGVTPFNTTLTATAGAGYSFEGWFTDALCTVNVGTENTKEVNAINQSMTYYALFTEDAPAQYTYTVTNNDGNGTVGNYGGKGVTPSTHMVYKGGTLTFDVTPKTGYILDTITTTSGVATHNGNKVTVSGFNEDFNVTVTFKQIETWTLNVALASKTYGSVKVTYYDNNGSTANQTVSDDPVAINVQKDMPVTLEATAKSDGEFTGWTLENGKYQRSASTPLSSATLTILPSANQTITANFSKTTTWKFFYAVGTNQGTLTSKGNMHSVPGNTNEVYYDIDVPADNIVCSFRGNNETSWESTYNTNKMTDPDGLTSNIERKENSQNYYNLVQFKSAGKVRFIVNTSSPFAARVESVPSSSDDTPSTTGYKDLYVLDGIVTRNNNAIQDYGTNEFGNSIIVSAKSGVLKYNFYDAVDDELFVHRADSHSEGQTIYYYNDQVDLDFRVQTTIAENHKNIGVRAYVMNGMTYPAKKSKDGVYYADITLDSHSNQGALEVIPVYYNTLIPEKDYIKFYVDANTIGDNWGKTIGYSIWYKNTDLHGMEGGYPGQPLLSDGNLLYGYFPKYYVGVNDATLPAANSRSKFAGVLLTNLAEHNLTHQDVLKDWLGTTGDKYKANYQTFDYEDPVKIAEIENVDTIEFIAKYQETNTDHQTGTHFKDYYDLNNDLINASTSTWPSGIQKPTASDLNGFEVLTDIDGNPVDIYNTKLTGGANFNDAVYVISVGNQIVTPNQWDTVWMVYSNADTPAFITAKNPAEFINVAEGSQSADLKGKTVYINYEKFLDGDAKQANFNSGDRIDGRWVYSRSSDDTTLRLRVATEDGSGNLTFKDDFLSWSEISDGYVTGIRESRPAGVTHDNWLLNLENRTTEVTAKINPVGYKVDGFYMLSARYSGAADNGFSSKITDYDDMNAEGTATSFINARDNRMVIVVSEIPNTDLLITHQMYGGPGAHKIKGFYYLKAELLDNNNEVVATYNNNSTAADDGTTNKDIMINKFTTAAPKGQGYKLKITIKTAMSGSATFYQWYENDHNNGYNMLDSDAARGSSDPVTTTKTINVDDLYGDEFLSIKNLDYYSDLQAADSININHLIIGDITDGQAYNKVTVTDSTGKAIKGGEYSPLNRTTVVDSSFITEDNADAGYQIKVEIWTVPGANTEFDKFYRVDESEMTTGSYEGVAYTTGESVTFNNITYDKATAMIPISYFFKDAPSEDGQSIIKVFDSTKKDFNLYSSLKDLSGELTITHQLLTPHSGTANTYIKVDLCDNNNVETANIIPQTNTTNTAGHDVTIGKAYIKPSSADRLKVTLTTEIGDWTDFIQFDRMVEGVKQQLTAVSDVQTTATVTINTDGLTTKTATILFRIVNLFDPQTKQQIMHRMDFLSEIEQPTFYYDITYKYNAYVSTYGEQSYNTSGVIDPTDLPTYMTYNHEELRFKDDPGLKRTYISNKAPLEDNFMTTISYANYSTAETTYKANTHTLTIEVMPQTNTSKVNVTLKLPYAHDAQTYEPQQSAIRTDGLVTESEPQAEARTVDCKGWLVGHGTQGQDSETQGKLNFIKAPLLLFNSTAPDKTKHFRYWEVKTQSKYGSEEKVYTRCYDYEFNLALFQNCTITPIYGEKGFDAEKMPNPPTAWNMYGRFDPYVERNADTEGAGGVTITFMENSRNQYNHNGSGNRDTQNGGVPTARQGAADRIYSDFLLSYNNFAGIEKLYEHKGEYKCGVVIEGVGELEKDSNGKYIINNEAYYKAKYDESKDISAVSALIDSASTSASGLMKAEFDCGELDNKNRTRYYVGLNNRAAAQYNADNPPEIGENYLSTTTKVLRAYAYIYKVGDNGEKQNIIISAPTYFTIYNIATVQDGGSYTE